MPTENQQKPVPITRSLSVEKTQNAPPKRLRRPPSANGVWVTGITAQAIMQVNSSHLCRLKATNEIRTKDGQYNLKDILERYQRQLHADGVIDQRIEAVCIREFKTGKLPEDVIEQHGFAWIVVKQAWTNWSEMRRDPEVRRIVAEREAAIQRETAERCRMCLRTPALASADSARIAQEVTSDPTRTQLNMDEERACTGLDIRCPMCRAIKGTAPLNEMRARIRVLRVVGLPKPIVLDPLPEPPPPATPATSATATDDHVPPPAMNGTTGE